MPCFISKTHQLIENAPDDLIQWANDGTSFIIKDPKRLEKEILHRYFNHSNFNSFARQLSFYGFRKSNKYLWLNSSKLATRCFEYCHKSFVRGRLNLMKEIKRKTNGTSSNPNDLKDKMCALSAQVDQLTETLEILLAKRRNRNTIEPIILENSTPLSLEEAYEFLEPIFNI